MIHRTFKGGRLGIDQSAKSMAKVRWLDRISVAVALGVFPAASSWRRGGYLCEGQWPRRGVFFGAFVSTSTRGGTATTSRDKCKHGNVRGCCSGVSSRASRLSFSRLHSCNSLSEFFFFLSFSLRGVYCFADKWTLKGVSFFFLMTIMNR